MKLTMLAKDDKSQKGDCPSVYMSDTGELVVQGFQLDASDLRELHNPLPGEAAVRISPEVVLKAIRIYEQNRPL
ncbi:hypothetical protein CLV63_12390 [Murinocardiopsis flavida]|uniref:Uncharacterized protein n=1 Tax=Murinocardiopsis flavida TaxID=645275 RepID=A0A2P8CZ66_9ACTN|nr:hypothetical protein [Murinocardiopsis flavida]PSK90261.1 hypothetical protein CLV63_12390 [Murinocardiopsis flavida]